MPGTASVWGLAWVQGRVQITGSSRKNPQAMKREMVPSQEALTSLTRICGGDPTVLSSLVRPPGFFYMGNVRMLCSKPGHQGLRLEALGLSSFDTCLEAGLVYPTIRSFSSACS